MSEDTILNDIRLQLARIADALETLAGPAKAAAPDYTRPIEEYAGFDWDSIHARVVKTDRDGPTHVEWQGQVYTRRSPSNKFDPAVWFSRATGRDEEGGDVTYARLITFRTIKEADPLPDKTRESFSRPPAQRQDATALAGQSTARPPAAPANGKPAASKPAAATQPAMTLTTPPPPAELVSYTTYVANAKARSIAAEAAGWLARQCQVEEGGDYARPNSYLDFFHDAKHAGFRLSEAWAHLEACRFDTDLARASLPKD